MFYYCSGCPCSEFIFFIVGHNERKKSHLKRLTRSWYNSLEIFDRYTCNACMAVRSVGSRLQQQNTRQWPVYLLYGTRSCVRRQRCFMNHVASIHLNSSCSVHILSSGAAEQGSNIPPQRSRWRSTAPPTFCV